MRDCVQMPPVSSLMEWKCFSKLPVIQISFWRLDSEWSGAKSKQKLILVLLIAGKDFLLILKQPIKRKIHTSYTQLLKKLHYKWALKAGLELHNVLPLLQKNSTSSQLRFPGSNSAEKVPSRGKSSLEIMSFSSDRHSSSSSSTASSRGPLREPTILYQNNIYRKAYKNVGWGNCILKGLITI